MGTKVTDPALLAELNAAPTSKKVTDPALLAELNKPATSSIGATEEAELADRGVLAEGLNLARDIFSGEAVARLPGQIRGADVTRAIDIGRRQHGMTPEYRQVAGSLPASALQLGANAAADVTGIVGAPLSLPIEVGVQMYRAVPDLLTGAAQDVATYARRQGYLEFEDAAQRALATQQERGESRFGAAVERRYDAAKEFAKGSLFGLSPALYAAGEALAEGGDVGTAAWETLKAYPVASLLPMVHAGRKAMTVGGKPVVREGVPIQTPRGKEVSLNKVGEKAFEPVTTALASPRVQGVQGAPGEMLRAGLEGVQRAVEPLWQRMAFDAVPAKEVLRQRAQAGAVGAARTPSPAAQDVFRAVKDNNVIRDIEDALRDPEMAKSSQRDIFAAMEGQHPETTAYIDAPAFDQQSKATAQQLGEELVNAGMSVEQAQLAVPYVLFEGTRHSPNNPMAAVTETLAQLQKMPDLMKGAVVSALDSHVTAKLNDPAFMALADRAWSAPDQSAHWVPRDKMRQRAGYVEALDSARAADTAAGKPVFDLSHPDLGEIRKAYTFDLFNGLVDELGNSKGGREKVMALLRSQPTSRMLVNPDAPQHVKALVSWANLEDGPRRKYLDPINQASIEVAQNLGVDPIVVAKHYDRYLSRTFKDALTANAELKDVLDAMGQSPAVAAKLGYAMRSGRFRRKLTDPEANQRFADLAQEAKVDLPAVLAVTAAQMVALPQHLHSMAAMHDQLASAGMISDTPKPGFVFTGREAAVDKKVSASGNPYNFALGKLADKWVDPGVGKQLGLFNEAVGQAPAWLSLWRVVKTLGNVPTYQSRNWFQDHTGIWAATGINGYAGKGRKVRLSTQADIDRAVFGDKSLSPMLAEFMEDTNSRLDDGPVLDNVSPQGRKYIGDVAASLSKANVSATDPGARMGALTQAMLTAKATAKLPKELLTALVMGHDRAKSGYAERVANGESPALAGSVGALSDWMRGLHDGLTSTAIAKWTAAADLQRKFYAYSVARELLGLDRDRAAILASDAAYGLERAPPGWSKVANTWWGAMLLPPFMNFGLWQLKKFGQRAFNDIGLHRAYAINQGVAAMNEHDLLADDAEQKDWRARLGSAYMKRSAAPDIGLGTGKDVADTLESAGLGDYAKALRRGTKALTFDLRDIGGYQTFLHNIRTDVTGPEYWLQFGPLGGPLSQFADPNTRDPFRPRTGVHQGAPGAWPHVKEYLGALFTTAAPSWASKAIDGSTLAHKAMQVQKAADTGKAVRPYPKGPETNLVDVATGLLGPLGLSTIDGVSMASAVSRRIKGQTLEIKRKSAGEMSQLTGATPAERADLSEMKIDAMHKVKQLELGVAMALGVQTPQQNEIARRRLRQIRDKAVQTARAKGDATGILSKWWEDPTIAEPIGRVQRAILDTLKAGDD